MAVPARIAGIGRIAAWAGMCRTASLYRSRISFPGLFLALFPALTPTGPGASIPAAGRSPMAISIIQTAFWNSTVPFLELFPKFIGR